jgi:predicted amidohydrolase YtcJ
LPLSNADLVLHNGRIYPDVKPQVRFEALAVKNSEVSNLGSNSDILRLAGSSTIKIDLHGNTVLPGFHDSHIHLLNFGMLLRNLDLTRTESIADLTRQVGESASTGPAEKWILGRGWDDEKLRDHRYPDRHDLDRVTSAPVFLKRICGHVAVANSTALSKAGIDLNTPDPEGGLIVRDSEGQANGILKERAIELVETVIPRSREATADALILASEKLAEFGLTTLHCVIGDLSELETLQDLKRRNKIGQFIYALIPFKLLDDPESPRQATQNDTPGFRVGGVKLFLDGSMGARTAALVAPYSDAPQTAGMLTMSRDEIQSITSKALERNLQLCLHAIGDRAVELAIQTITEASLADSKNHRHRIEHASLTSHQAVKKMAKEGIIASVQPRFIFSDTWAADRLGPARLDNLYPFRSMLSAGILLAAGSDCPVEDPNPFEGIWSAIRRPGLDTKERLTVEQVLQMYTVNAAYASFSEAVSGTLDVGKVADMVVIDRDPFECSPDELRKSRVLKTIINGITVA